MSQNRVIGNKNSIPWDIPEDFKWVKKMTSGQAIVMGRKTFESIGRPLPNRDNIIISRTLDRIDGAIVFNDLEAVKEYKTDRQIWIFGGAEIYKMALPYCKDLYLTVIKKDVDGDAFFPPFEDLFELKEIIRDEEEFTINHYVNTQIDKV